MWILYQALHSVLPVSSTLLLTPLERRKTNEKEAEKGPADPGCDTACVFSSFIPALFSTAFAGIKSIFQVLAAHQPITWNSFLDVTGVLLVITILFGRHFCGYACAFGSLGDAMYELTLFIRQKVFHKKGRHGYTEKVVRMLQKVKYILLAFLMLSILNGWYANLQGMSPWDVFSMLTAGKLPNASYKIGIALFILILIGMCTQERFFLSVSLPDGGCFCDDADTAGGAFSQRSREMSGKMWTLQKALSGTSGD